MLPYFLLLSIPSYFALYYRKRNSKITLFSVALIFIFFIGFRYRVGADWPGYESIHLSLHDEDLAQVLSRQEPLSYLLFWISENSGFEMLLSNIGAAIILLFGVFSFARRTQNPWLAIVAATPYLIIAFGMTGIRQVMGIGLILYMLSHWQKNNSSLFGHGSVFSQSAIVILASLFHTSAVFGSLLIIPTLKTRLWIKIIVGIMLGLIAFYMSQSTDNYSSSFEVYQQRYLDDPNAVVSAGSIFHIGLIIIPAILGFIFRSRIKNIVFNYELLILGISGAFGLLALNMISTTVASRLTLYFYFIPMMVYPALTLAFGNKNRKLLTAMFISIHFIILATWFFYGNNSFAHLPYRNLLFENS